MRILVFSDTHLSRRFEKKKFDHLKKLINSSDRVIINGDFWDGYTTTFDRFMKSRWNELFPLLKSKKAVYVIGNHDKKEFTDKRVFEFCDTYVPQYKLKLKGVQFVFEHGNRLASARDENIKQKWLLFGATHFAGFLEHVSIRLFKRNLLSVIGKTHNKIIKQKLKTEFDSVYFVCGHTHSPEHDIQNRFINHGIIRHGISQYLLIDNGTIITKEEWYD